MRVWRANIEGKSHPIAARPRQKCGIVFDLGVAFMAIGNSDGYEYLAKFVPAIGAWNRPGSSFIRRDTVIVGLAFADRDIIASLDPRFWTA